MTRKAQVKYTSPHKETLDGLKPGDAVRFNTLGHEIIHNSHNFTGVVLEIATPTIVYVDWKMRPKVQRYELSKTLRKSKKAGRSKA